MSSTEPETNAVGPPSTPSTTPLPKPPTRPPEPPSSSNRDSLEGDSLRLDEASEQDQAIAKAFLFYENEKKRREELEDLLQAERDDAEHHTSQMARIIERQLEEKQQLKKELMQDREELSMALQEIAALKQNQARIKSILEFERAYRLKTETDTSSRVITAKHQLQLELRKANERITTLQTELDTRQQRIHSLQLEYSTLEGQHKTTQQQLNLLKELLFLSEQQLHRSRSGGPPTESTFLPDSSIEEAEQQSMEQLWESDDVELLRSQLKKEYESRVQLQWFLRNRSASATTAATTTTATTQPEEPSSQPEAAVQQQQSSEDSERVSETLKSAEGALQDARDKLLVFQTRVQELEYEKTKLADENTQLRDSLHRQSTTTTSSSSRHSTTAAAAASSNSSYPASSLRSPPPTIPTGSQAARPAPLRASTLSKEPNSLGSPTRAGLPYTFHETPNDVPVTMHASSNSTSPPNGRTASTAASSSSRNGTPAPTTSSTPSQPNPYAAVYTANNNAQSSPRSLLSSSSSSQVLDSSSEYKASQQFRSICERAGSNSDAPNQYMKAYQYYSNLSREQEKVWKQLDALGREYKSLSPDGLILRRVLHMLQQETSAAFQELQQATPSKPSSLVS